MGRQDNAYKPQGHRSDALRLAPGGNALIALFSGRDVAKRVFLDESARKGYMGKRLASLSCLALFLAFGDFDNPQGGQSHASAKGWSKPCLSEGGRHRKYFYRANPSSELTIREAVRLSGNSLPEMASLVR